VTSFYLGAHFSVLQASKHPVFESKLVICMIKVSSG
jgi:hypothetical protein